MQVSTPAPARKSNRNLSVLLIEDSRLLAERLRETILNVPGVQRVGSVDMSQYAPQLSSTINLVAASLGISIVPRSMQGLRGSGASADNSLRSAAAALKGTLVSDGKRLEIRHFCFAACGSSIRQEVFAGPKSLDAPEPSHKARCRAAWRCEPWAVR